MAITKPTPKDVGNYESKLVGPFTQRQTICLATGIVPCMMLGTLCSALHVNGYDIIVFCVLIMIIPCFLAFGSKLCYGMKPEDFLTEYIIYHIKSKKIRLYETVTLDDKLEIVRNKGKKNEPNVKTKQDKKKEKTIVKTKFKDKRFKPLPHIKSKEYISLQ